MDNTVDSLLAHLRSLLTAYENLSDGNADGSLAESARVAYVIERNATLLRVATEEALKSICGPERAIELLRMPSRSVPSALSLTDLVRDGMRRFS